MKSVRTILPLIATALLLGACNTVPPRTAEAAPTPAPAPVSPAASKNLRKGMTEQEIRSIWGEPKATPAGKEKGETIMVYRFDALTTQRMVAATVNEWQTIDPISGAPRTVIDPVLSPQQVTVVQTIVLQLIDGKLVSWARQFGEDRSIK
jgi:hypothetical protein